MLPVFWIVGILQALTIYAVFRTKNFTDAPPDNNFFQKIIPWAGFMTILAVGGFFWLALPANALNTVTAWAAFMVNFFVVIMGGLVALAKSQNNNEPPKNTERTIISLIPLLYLVASECLIYGSIIISGSPPVIAIFSMMISYFPVRFIMMVRPPQSYIELVTALSGFFYFMYSLFQ